MLISYTIPSYCVHADYDLISVNRLLYILFVFMVLICFFILSVILYLINKMDFMRYRLFESKLLFDRYNYWYVIYYDVSFLCCPCGLAICLVCIVYFDIYYFSKLAIWICFCELLILAVLFVCVNIIGHFFCHTSSYQTIFMNSLYLELKDFEYLNLRAEHYLSNNKIDQGSYELSKWHTDTKISKLNSEFPELIKKINNNPPEISEVYMKQLNEYGFGDIEYINTRTVRASKEVEDAFKKILSKTDVVSAFALLCVIIMFVVLHYVVFKYFFTYDINIFAVRENDSWKLDSIKIDVSKDGKYMLYI